MDEQVLIHAAQRGNLEAFNQLVLAYEGFLFRIAHNILGDEDAAADATQEAFLSAFRKIRFFRGGSLRSWLARVVTNACYDSLRRTSRRLTLPLGLFNQDQEEMEPGMWLAAPDPSPEAQAESLELEETIQRCLNALPLNHRMVVLLVDVEEMSYEEAAAVLRVPAGTVKSRLARARAALRARLQSFPELLPAAYQMRAVLPVGKNLHAVEVHDSI